MFVWEGMNFMFSDNESQAMNGLRKLDPQIIGSIYDRYFPEIYRYVCYRINDDSVAEDISSDVFVRLLEATRKGQSPQSNLKGWLIATASNVTNDYLRRQYRRPTEPLAESLPDANSSVTAQVDLREQTRTVQFGLGYSLEETAGYLKKNANAVKALQFRALASLQRQIGEADHE
jgi:RNA polymerase sigma-70 factor, ECF subfamily